MSKWVWGLSLVMALSAPVFSAPAVAATITETTLTGGQAVARRNPGQLWSANTISTTFVNGNAPGINQIQQFDPSLGTLTDIDFTVTGEFGPHGSFQYNHVFPITTFSLVSTFMLTAPGMSLTLTDTYGSCVAPSNCVTATVINAFDPVLEMPTFTGNLADWTVTGTVILNAVTTVDFTWSDGFLSSAAVAATAAYMSLVVTYTYTPFNDTTPVPLPGSAALLLGALGAAPVVARRRRAKPT